MARTSSRWPTRRVVTLVFTLLNAGLLINLLVLGFSNLYFMVSYAMIAAFGALYVAWGPDPPPLFYKISEWSAYLGGAEVEPANSPRHLPYRIVIPLLIVTLLIAASLIVYSIFLAHP
jgi:hypothetical protein